ncbi:hypothetical protein BGZ99_005209 [Dissophora globulifera]|uniref:Uncharacterized protein n=1 Tax=Dissophora globulifera TaxID=979702 RepID=A0A9P6UTP7_9FUNG|nr:hypothetical protein BGZ99_005209 [Dissophora globulifera]
MTECDLVRPPISLQHRMFLRIEINFNADAPKDTEFWIRECDLEIEGADSPSTPQDFYHIPIIKPTSGRKLIKNPAMNKMVREKGTAKITYGYLIDLIAFPKLLVRVKP